MQSGLTLMQKFMSLRKNLDIELTGGEGQNTSSTETRLLQKKVRSKGQFVSQDDSVFLLYSIRLARLMPIKGYNW